jgi:hypothetical protein
MRVVGILLAALLLAHGALAGTEITLETRQAGAPAGTEPRHSWIAIEGRNLHAETRGGSHSLSYRGVAGVLEVYDHRDQTVFRLDRSTASSVASKVDSARDAVEALPEAQRRALESVIGTRPKAPAVELRETGKGDAVGDVACRLLELWESGARRAEICEAPPGAAGVPPEALATVRELIAFGADVADLIPGSLGGENLAALEGVERIKGVPLRVRAWPRNEPASESRIVRAIPRDYPAEHFQAPAGYRPGLGIQVGPEAGH